MSTPDRSAASRLRELAEDSQGGGYTSWVDQYGEEVVSLDTHQVLVDDHAEMRAALEALLGKAPELAGERV